LFDWGVWIGYTTTTFGIWPGGPAFLFFPDLLLFFSSENGVITVAIDTGSADASTGIQFLSFSYDAELNRYIVRRHPFRPDIAISALTIASDFSGGYVTIHFSPSPETPWAPDVPCDYFFTSEKPHANPLFRVDRRQAHQYEPACVHAPCFVTPETITLIS